MTIQKQNRQDKNKPEKKRSLEEISNKNHNIKRAFIYLDNLLRAVFRSKTELIKLSVLIDFCC